MLPYGKQILPREFALSIGCFQEKGWRPVSGVMLANDDLLHLIMAENDFASLQFIEDLKTG